MTRTDGGESQELTGSLIEDLTAMGADAQAGLAYCAGSEELYRTVLGVFVGEHAAKAPQLAELLAQGDWHNYGIQAHALKGSARTVGFNDLADLALGSELAAKEGRLDDLRAAHEPLLAAYADTVARLDRVLHVPSKS